jgi:hypothetical protein
MPLAKQQVDVTTCLRPETAVKKFYNLGPGGRRMTSFMTTRYEKARENKSDLFEAFLKILFILFSFF